MRIMGRKVTFEEKQAIVQWTIDHQNNYQAAVEKFDVSYQRTYDWESLRDNRGRNKGKEPTTELERLRQQVRQLKAEKREMEVQIAFAKKLIKIQNREVHKRFFVNWY
ncbi:hypothetical protein IV41_GL001021 [Limosilactobacillus ingluviei]|uniref:Transposase n=1 Tax=Limosilactobacillus ingluviei TaxID=148604 RepID=A0A0R2GST6_9LACO|nr:hypothetical protein IV41_GL001021 [Limosilactobacillus ingluviei]